MNQLIVKGIILLFIVAIFYSLISALYFLMRDKGKGDRSVKALSWRVGLSFFLFVLLFVAYALGWIHPHNL